MMFEQVQGSEVEWESEGTEMTSCTSSMESDGGSSSRLECDDDELPQKKQNIHGVSSIINNLASSTAKSESILKSSNFPTVFISHTVSCLIWEGDEVKKVDWTVLDVGWTIIKRVERIPEKADYLKMGVLFSVLLVFMPCAFRLYHSHETFVSLNWMDISDLLKIPDLIMGENWR
jgi:hypothetical protein